MTAKGLAPVLARWALMAVAAVALVFVPLCLARSQEIAVESTSAWTSADPGDTFADTGWLSFPWFVVLVVLGVAVLERVWARARRKPSTMAIARSQQGNLVAHLAIAVPLALGTSIIASSDPLVYGASQDPGPELAETLMDGVWSDEKGSVGLGLSSDNRAIAFVYEIAGWRRVGWVYPPFGITVPTIEGCMPDPF